MFWCSNRQGTGLQHTYTHPFNGPFPGLPRWSSTRKVKPIWILLKQETVGGSGISWAISKSAPRSRETTTPAPNHYCFLQVGWNGCPFCHSTNSVKALKALAYKTYLNNLQSSVLGTWQHLDKNVFFSIQNQLISQYLFLMAWQNAGQQLEAKRQYSVRERNCFRK